MKWHGLPVFIFTKTGFHRVSNNALDSCDVIIETGANLYTVCHDRFFNHSRLRRLQQTVFC